MGLPIAKRREGKVFSLFMQDDQAAVGLSRWDPGFWVLKVRPDGLRHRE